MDRKATGKDWCASISDSTSLTEPWPSSTGASSKEQSNGWNNCGMLEGILHSTKKEQATWMNLTDIVLSEDS